MNRIWLWAILGAAWAVTTAVAAPQAIEIGPDNTADLPGGREADGIIGDFVLRNDRVEVVISGNQHQRKANMSNYYDAPTAGCVYDMTLRGTNNDQLTLFAPCGQRGQMSNVRIIATRDEGEAIVRAERSAAAGRGLSVRHDYVLRDGTCCLLIRSALRNSGSQPVKFKAAPGVPGLFRAVTEGDVTAADGPDPAYKQSYAWAPAPGQESGILAGESTLAPGEERRIETLLAVGTSPAAAYGEIAAACGETARVWIAVRDGDNAPVATASVLFPMGKGALAAFPDAEGRIELSLPLGEYAVTGRDIGRPDVAATIDVTKEGATAEMVFAPAARVAVDVRDEQGGGLPCKVQFIGRDGTKDPDLGPVVRAHGCDNQYQSETGAFTQALPPGAYTVVVTHGIEYDHAEQAIEVAAGKSVDVRAVLRRVVDTRGWISTDFHNHTTVSGDNYCGTRDRLINLAAENVEFAPTTEHNRLFDWKPFIDELGLADRLATVSGIELTGGGPHLNAFPLKVVPFTQGNGAPEWNPDPRDDAIRLRAMPGADDSRWVHLNHPQMREFFNDRNKDGKPDGGYTGLEGLLDGCELMAVDILSGKPMTKRYDGKERENWGFLWLQMLNAGRPLRPVVVSDAHEVTKGGVGGWRMYVPSSTDEPGRVDKREILLNAKAGRTMVTTGPFLEVRTDDGHSYGETIVGKHDVTLHVRVQCNTWTGVNRVAVLVNGRVPEALSFTMAKNPELFRKGPVAFEHEIPVKLDRDAHLIVVAVGEGMTLARGYGHSWQSTMPPIAFHNPIFVDVDGNGFQPNGDDLGHPFLDPAPPAPAT